MAESVIGIIFDFTNRAMAQMNMRVTHCWLPTWQWDGLLAETNGLRPWRQLPAYTAIGGEDVKSLVLHTQFGGIIVEEAQYPYPTIAWSFEEEHG